MMTRFLLILLLPGYLHAQTFSVVDPVIRYDIDDPVPLVAEVVATNLDLPWDLVWGPDDKIWFTERTGALKRYDPSSGLVEVLDTIPGVFNSSDNSGLHALFLHPDFENEPWLYVNYTYTFNDLRLSRFRFSESGGLGVEDTLLELAGQDSHNGARFVLDQTGKLLFATGDAFNPFLPQDTTSPNGKILRLNLDGSTPDDNPIPGNPLYSTGHRNPQGLVMLPNGELWETEHGEDQDDELNRIVRGGNYGWPEVSGLCDTEEEEAFCATYNVQEPHRSWTPTAGPSGLAYYDHPAIPQWRNSLIAGFLKRRGEPGQRIKVIALNEDGTETTSVTDYLHDGPIIPTDLEQLFQVGIFGRIRDVMAAPDGSVYLCTSNREFNGRYVVTELDDRIIRVYNPAWNTEFASEGEVLIYPNPATSGASVYLKFGGDLTGTANLRLYDAAGRLTRESSLEASPFTVFGLPGLAPGNYLLRIEFPDGETERTVKLQVSP